MILLYEETARVSVNSRSATPIWAARPGTCRITLPIYQHSDHDNLICVWRRYESWHAMFERSSGNAIYLIVRLMARRGIAAQSLAGEALSVLNPSPSPLPTNFPLDEYGRTV